MKKSQNINLFVILQWKVGTENKKYLNFIIYSIVKLNQILIILLLILKGWFY